MIYEAHSVEHKQFLKEARMRIIIFMQTSYLHRQMVEAMTCPINRHGTRVEHGCDDWGLFYNPQWLMDHYVNNGGPKEFAKRRAEFQKEVEIPDAPKYEIEI